MSVDLEQKGISKVQPDEMLSDAQRELNFDSEAETQEKLATHDLEVIKSLQTEWGTVLAGPAAKESDPYNRVWIRDNALVALALIQAGETELATQITEGLLGLMERYRPKIQEIIKKGKPYATERDASLIHPVYHASGKELEIEWGWHQNDAIGSLLQVAGTLGLAADYKEIVQDLVDYLDAVEYWQKDRGIWEEGKQVQVNTLLSCAAGLKAVSDYVEVPDEMIDVGYQFAEEIEGHSDKRYSDLARLNPFFIGELADPRIIQEVEHELLREKGVIRYHGDRYMSGGKNKEAQWVLGLLMLGQAWMACERPDKARAYLDNVDKLRVKNGDIPEAYIYKENPKTKKGKYVPGEHTPLAWAHALALSLRRQLKEKENL